MHTSYSCIFEGILRLKYDFDMHSVFPDELFTDPKVGDLLGGVGLSAQMAGNKVALFRSQETVDALRNAPETLRKLFVDSGFGLNRYDSGAPTGTYLIEDESARNRVLQRLNENVKAAGSGLKSLDGGLFDMGEFFIYLASAHPVTKPVSIPPSQAPAKDFKLARLAGFLIVAAAILVAWQLFAYKLS